MFSYQKSDIKMVPPSCYSENKRSIFKPKTQTVTEKNGCSMPESRVAFSEWIPSNYHWRRRADGNVKGVKMVGAQIHSLC